MEKAPFIHEQTGIDGNKKVNGRKRHIITDTLGLVWSKGLLPMPKASSKGLLWRMPLAWGWLDTLFSDIELEIAAKLPSSKGFVPVKIRWVTEQTFGIFNFQSAPNGSLPQRDACGMGKDSSPKGCLWHWKEG